MKQSDNNKNENNKLTSEPLTAEILQKAFDVAADINLWHERLKAYQQFVNQKYREMLEELEQAKSNEKQ